MSLTLRFWGTRGSIPSPGLATARYGGNTPCVELRTADGWLVILDAGTGIRELGRSLMARAIDKPLTHQTIAQMIGASRETVSRAMKEFQDAGLITVQRRRIAVGDREALAKRSQVRM